MKPLAATSKSLELAYPSRILEEEEVEVGVTKMGGQGDKETGEAGEAGKVGENPKLVSHH